MPAKSGVCQWWDQNSPQAAFSLPPTVLPVLQPSCAKPTVPTVRTCF